MNITINTPSGLYYGVYNDSGEWKQSNFENLPTHLAILYEIPTTEGRYNANIIAQGEKTFARTESVFNVKFTPETEGTINDTLYTELLLGVGRDLDFPAKRFLLNQYRS